MFFQFVQALESLQHPLFGNIYIRTNPRSVRYVFRPAYVGTPQQGLIVTAPSHYDVSDIMRAIQENQAKLQAMLRRVESQQKLPDRRIDWDFCINTHCLRIELLRGERASYYLHEENARIVVDDLGEVVILSPAFVQIICPKDCDFDSEERQNWLQRVIIEAIRRQAKLQLLPRLRALARKHQISLREVKVNSSKSHWGSCSRHRQRGTSGEAYFNINLSLFTLLLPMPVQRLILLHELCHTRHMDHSDSFHHDLDLWLDGQEQDLEKQLKAFRSDIFSFVQQKQL